MAQEVGWIGYRVVEDGGGGREKWKRKVMHKRHNQSIQSEAKTRMRTRYGIRRRRIPVKYGLNTLQMYNVRRLYFLIPIYLFLTSALFQE